MSAKHININGTSDYTYNLDEIKNDSRLNGSMPLVVQIHTYTKGQNPNPSGLVIGQMWYSKLVEATPNNNNNQSSGN